MEHFRLEYHFGWHVGEILREGHLDKVESTFIESTLGPHKSKPPFKNIIIDKSTAQTGDFSTFLDD